MATESELKQASNKLLVETLNFVYKLREKFKCSDFEATVLAVGIISDLIDTFSEEELQEFEQFLAKVRESQKD